MSLQYDVLGRDCYSRRQAVLGQEADALQDLSNGMAMRAMEKSKTDIS